MTDITRAVAIRRGLRNLDGNGSTLGWPGDSAIELELGRAYDAGHIAAGRTNIPRAVAIRRGLRNLDAVASSPVDVFDEAAKLELARAYDAGHIAGSGVKNQTDAEQHLAEVARELTGYQIHLITETISPELGAALEAVLETRETEPCPIPGAEFDVGAEL